MIGTNDPSAIGAADIIGGGGGDRPVALQLNTTAHRQRFIAVN